MQPKFRFVFLALIGLLLSSCSNQFEYKENQWLLIGKNAAKNQSSYVDANRIDCKDDNCTAWVKIEFESPQQIEFSGSKPGTQSGYILTSRIDSSVKYNCKKLYSTMISYQLYGKDGTLVDSKWLSGTEVTVIKEGTVDYDIWKFVCSQDK